MPRLNAEMRHQIVVAVTDHAFKARITEHRNNHAALAEEVYNDCYDAATRRRMEALPKSWLPTDDDIKVSAGMRTIRLDFAGAESQYAEHRYLHDQDVKPIFRRFPTGDKGSTVKVYDPEHPITVKIDKFKQDRAKLIEAISETRAKTAATIETFFTTEKLVEAWPEITPFIPEKARPQVALPAIPTDDLNKMLGLPATTDV